MKMQNYPQLTLRQPRYRHSIAGQSVLRQPDPGTAVSMILTRKARDVFGRVLRVDKIPELKVQLERILKEHSVPGRFFIFYTETSKLMGIEKERAEIEEEYLEGTRIQTGINVKTPATYYPLWGTYLYVWTMTHDLKRLKKEIFAHFNLADMRKNSNGDGDENRDEEVNRNNREERR
jgi:hypothetical protein